MSIGINHSPSGRRALQSTIPRARIATLAIRSSDCLGLQIHPQVAREPLKRSNRLGSRCKLEQTAHTREGAINRAGRCSFFRTSGNRARAPRLPRPVPYRGFLPPRARGCSSLGARRHGRELQWAGGLAFLSPRASSSTLARATQRREFLEIQREPGNCHPRPPAALVLSFLLSEPESIVRTVSSSIARALFQISP